MALITALVSLIVISVLLLIVIILFARLRALKEEQLNIVEIDEEVKMALSSWFYVHKSIQLLGGRGEFCTRTYNALLLIVHWRITNNEDDFVERISPYLDEVVIWYGINQNKADVDVDWRGFVEVYQKLYKVIVEDAL